jgi:hypothetical protein
VRTLILAGLLVAGLVAAGVIHIQNNNNTIDITVDRQKLDQTERAAMQVGSQFFQQAETQIQNAQQPAQYQTK